MPLLFLALLFGCKPETSEIGVNLRPDGGSIDSETFSLSDYVCRTIGEDSLRTDTLSTNNLGAIEDPIFGTRVASLIVQPQLDELNYDFTGFVIDSVFLTLKYQGQQLVDDKILDLVYGDLESVMKIDVYTLGEDLVRENKYYSNFQPSMGTKVGTYNGKFRFYDSTWSVNGSDSTLVFPELRIQLDNSFGQSILEQGPATFATSDDFLLFLKGLVLVPDASALSPGQGAIVAINAKTTNSSLSLHYEDSLSVQFPLTSVSERINLWSTTNTPATITSQVAGSGHYNTTYMQSLDGNKIRIDLPQLDSFIINTPEVAINEAKFEIYVDQTTVSPDFSPPYRAILAIPGENGATTAFIDFADDAFPLSLEWSIAANYGGRYNESEGKYVFHFNRYLQQLLKEYKETGVNNFDGFYLLVPSDNPMVSSRAVLNSDPSLGGIKVSIAYTKLN